MEVPTPPTRPPRRRPECRRWAAGRCADDRCRYAHPPFAVYRARLKAKRPAKKKNRCYCGGRLMRIPKYDLYGDILLYFTLCRRTKQSVYRCHISRE